MRVSVCGAAWVLLNPFTDLLIGNKSRAGPTQRFLSSFSSECFPGAHPSPSGELKKPSSSNCAFDGQAPGELPEFQVCDPGVARPHLQGSGPF